MIHVERCSIASSALCCACFLSGKCAFHAVGMYKAQAALKSLPFRWSWKDATRWMCSHCALLLVCCLRVGVVCCILTLRLPVIHCVEVECCKFPACMRLLVLVCDVCKTLCC